MADQDFWKKAYQKEWGEASKRENRMIKMIQDKTGLEAEPYGLGAGSTEFLHGSAASNGSKKGDADLHIKDTNIYIEVTGPLVDSVPTSAPLWFRPDKIENAISSLKEHDTYLVHHCPSEDCWRFVHVDSELKDRYENKEFPINPHSIRGNTETYAEIPANDPCVKPISELFDHLKDDPKDDE